MARVFLLDIYEWYNSFVPWENWYTLSFCSHAPRLPLGDWAKSVSSIVMRKELELALV